MTFVYLAVHTQEKLLTHGCITIAPRSPRPPSFPRCISSRITRWTSSRGGILVLDSWASREGNPSMRSSTSFCEPTTTYQTKWIGCTIWCGSTTYASALRTLKSGLRLPRERSLSPRLKTFTLKRMDVPCTPPPPLRHTHTHTHTHARAPALLLFISFTLVGLMYGLPGSSVNILVTSCFPVARCSAVKFRSHTMACGPHRKKRYRPMLPSLCASRQPPGETVTPQKTFLRSVCSNMVGLSLLVFDLVPAV